MTIEIIITEIEIIERIDRLDQLILELERQITAETIKGLIETQEGWQMPTEDLDKEIMLQEHKQSQEDLLNLM